MTMSPFQSCCGSLSRRMCRSIPSTSTATKAGPRARRANPARQGLRPRPFASNEITTPPLSSFSSSSLRATDAASLPHSSPEVQALVDRYARKPQTSASLQTIMRTGRGELLHKMKSSHAAGAAESESESEATPLVLLQVASFLRREMPIRFAHRIHDLKEAPLLKDMASVRQVRELYTTSLLEVLGVDKQPPASEGGREDWEQSFAQILENIYERHGSVLVQMARGAFELRAAVRRGEAGADTAEFELMESTHAFLDRFYISRIGIRVLIGQYLSLRQPSVDNYVGIVCSRTSPYEIVKRAIDDAAFMCTRKYGDAPEVIIAGRLDL